VLRRRRASPSPWARWLSCGPLPPAGGPLPAAPARAVPADTPATLTHLLGERRERRVEVKLGLTWNQGRGFFRGCREGGVDRGQGAWWAGRAGVGGGCLGRGHACSLRPPQFAGCAWCKMPLVCVRVKPPIACQAPRRRAAPGANAQPPRPRPRPSVEALVASAPRARRRSRCALLTRAGAHGDARGWGRAGAKASGGGRATSRTRPRRPLAARRSPPSSAKLGSTAGERARPPTRGARDQPARSPHPGEPGAPPGPRGQGPRPGGRPRGRCASRAWLEIKVKVRVQVGVLR
jgi:hypothetical protein